MVNLWRKHHGLIRTALLASVSVLAIIAAHRFRPDRWPELASELLQSLHGPGFALLAVVVLWYLQRKGRRPGNYLVAAAAAMAVGFVSEAAQIPGPRDAQVKDLVIDGLGIAGALLLIGFFDPDLKKHFGTKTRNASLTLGLAALAYAAIPTVWITYALVQQLRATPTLLNFEHWWESATYSQPEKRRPHLVAAPDGWPISGSTIAEAAGAGQWDIFLSLNPPRDWSAYSRMTFVAAAAEEPFKLAVAISDMRPRRKTPFNRYSASFNIGSAAARYSISFDEIRAAESERPFDFGFVDSVVFSASKPGGGAKLLLDDVRLE